MPYIRKEKHCADKIFICNRGEALTVTNEVSIFLYNLQTFLFRVGKYLTDIPNEKDQRLLKKICEGFSSLSTPLTVTIKFLLIISARCATSFSKLRYRNFIMSKLLYYSTKGTTPKVDKQRSRTHY